MSTFLLLAGPTVVCVLVGGTIKLLLRRGTLALAAAAEPLTADSFAGDSDQTWPQQHADDRMPAAPGPASAPVPVGHGTAA